MVPKITLHRERGSWQACKDGAPSTWILKRGGQLTEIGGDIIDTEVACLALARAVELTTVDAEVVTYGEVRGIAVSRYDRNGQLGREHQEDLAQAIGLNTSDPNRKFQWGSAMPSLRDAANVLRDGGANQDPLLRLVTFSLLIGNTDLHAKNISYLRHADGSVELSPAYDVAMHLHHRPDDRRNALDINGKFLIDALTIDDVVAEGMSWGLPAVRARRVVADTVEAVRAALAGIDRSTHPNVSAEAWAVVDRRVQEATDRLPVSTAATKNRAHPRERLAGGRRGPKRPKST
ncbi:type II toxin-antitoxin system HipA family toxin [Janibacter sp. HTCC2649]|uniref:type II toxin-antitoxin system HipA family toxin n=1 Tax=Janibacter sp. HTCC2649 TaxID=313589 RepID=UPI001ED90CDC|nr:HipA domain-containing protein [Janibacter sp. HTCC2649]